jgi:hypothetical protein
MPKLPFFVLALMIAAPVRAQHLPEEPADAQGQAIDPPATTGDKETDGRRPWDTVPPKKIVKMSNAVKLYAIQSGQRKDYYMIWRYTDHRSTPNFLAFTEPADANHPAPPKEYFLTRKRLPTKPSVQSKAHPAGTVQTWRFGPESGSGEWGLVAEASGFGEGKNSQKNTTLYPILWWGLAYGQELDELKPSEIAKLAASKKLFPYDGK